MRVRLQSGYNALVTPKVEPHTLLLGLSELLFAEGYDPAAASLAATGARTTGGGATLMGADGATFRVMRDLVAGSAQLLQFDRESRSFSQVSTDTAEIGQFLRARVGLCSRLTFDCVFVLRPQDLPSQEGVPEIELPPAEMGPDPAVLKERLAELEGVLAEQQRVEELEFELDGVQKQRFAIEDKLKAVSFDRGQLEEAQAQAKRIKYLDALPYDFLPRYEAYQKIIERRDADLERWQSERDRLERNDRAFAVDPLLKDWRLWTGLGVGTLAIAVAVGGALVLAPTLRWAALLDIPSFGLAAFVLFNNLNQREQRNGVRRRLAISDLRRGKIVDRDKAEIDGVESILAQVGLESAEEVRRGVKMRQEVRDRIARLEEEERAMAANPELTKLTAQRDELAATAAEMESRLATMSAGPADTLAVRSEVDHLRAELEGLEPEPTAEVETVEPATVGPMGQDWHKAALDLLLTDPMSAAKVLGERASLLIRALSDNQLVGVNVRSDGSVQLKSAQGGEAAWDAMPQVAQDLAYLALRGGLFLAVDQRSRVPMVAGDIGGRMPSGLRITQTLFTTLAHGGQVIHVVRRPDLAPGAKVVSQAVVK
ncbi:hypothetical protein ACFL6C_06535 [Myxococcota bacterium]